MTPCLCARTQLTLRQDRVLATCEENKLEYATDPTNFQPDLTQRNFVRHILAGNVSPLTPARAEDYAAICASARRLGVEALGDEGGRARLRAIVEMLGEQRDDTDRRGN